jgi:hypothetical protein
MEQASFWESDSIQADPGFIWLLWYPKGHYIVARSLSLDQYVKQMNALHTPTSY